jgi:hypothetical protein
MKRLIALCLGFLAIIAFSGCAMISTSGADLSKDSNGNLDKDPKGIRVYPTRVYLLVDNDDVRFEFWPDYTCAYSVRPIAFFGSNDFRIELENGQITKISSNMDTTASLELMKELMKKAVSFMVLKEIKGDEIGPPPNNEPQIFRMGDDGIFRRVECIRCK